MRYGRPTIYYFKYVECAFNFEMVSVGLYHFAVSIEHSFYLYSLGGFACAGIFRVDLHRSNFKRETKKKYQLCEDSPWFLTSLYKNTFLCQ